MSKLSTVWEDNNATLILANKEISGITPRGKHIAVKYYWYCFRGQAGLIERIAIE